MNATAARLTPDGGRRDKDDVFSIVALALNQLVYDARFQLGLFYIKELDVSQPKFQTQFHDWTSLARNLEKVYWLQADSVGKALNMKTFSFLFQVNNYRQVLCTATGRRGK